MAINMSFSLLTPTLTGFRRRIMKFSALCIMNRANLRHNKESSSSFFLILMLIRTELIDFSTNISSFVDLISFSSGKTE
jgi:hypothetical protein